MTTRKHSFERVKGLLLQPKSYALRLWRMKNGSTKVQKIPFHCYCSFYLKHFFRLFLWLYFYICCLSYGLYVWGGTWWITHCIVFVFERNVINHAPTLAHGYWFIYSTLFFFAFRNGMAWAVGAWFITFRIIKIYLVYDNSAKIKVATRSKLYIWICSITHGIVFMYEVERDESRIVLSLCMSGTW